MVVFAALLAMSVASSVSGAPLIAVDVGHSLAAPGATSATGRAEFDFNRDLALDIESELKQAGFDVLLVGAQGEMVQLSARTRAARNAQFFLSVHHDSVQPHYLSYWEPEGAVRRYSDRFSGFSLFVSRNNPDAGRSLACASAVGRSLRSAGFHPSLYHAERVRGESKPFADRMNGVHYFHNLVVLKTARQPAVLLEAGVIVNRSEERAISERDTRRRIGAAVAEGLRECLN